MSFLPHTLFFFVIALIILIAVHEYGHYWVARKLGVKVLRFSLGFGKIIWRRQKSADDTEFTLSALPLGGYVKMVDEREGEVAPGDLPFAFNRKPVAVRSAIVLAGPVFNFLLAVLVYWLAFMWGETGTRPVVGEIKAGTLAAEAGFREGDEIRAIGADPTPTWSAAISEIMDRVLDEAPIPVTVAADDGTTRELTLTVPAEVARKPDILYKKLGLRPFDPMLEPVIDHVEPGSAAERAGLQSGDRVISGDGTVITHWKQWVEFVRARPELPIHTVIERDGVRLNLDITPQGTDSDDGRIGRIGAAVQIPDHVAAMLKVEYRLGVLPALHAAFQKTADYSLLTVKMVGRMLIGKAGVENLSGPISIAQYAGQSASLGFGQFMKFLALVSISLGVLNLLPIPVLDGGHLLFYLVEAVKGSPLSEQTQIYFQQIGMFVLICLMVLGFYLDIGRLFAS
jgi:regulator of sigma E protease